MMEFERKNIFLSLETDLAPTPFAKLIERVASAALRVNYDIGIALLWDLSQRRI